MPWNPIREPFDFVDFAGQATPGLAEVVGLSTPRRFDERESVGLSGAIVFYMGHRLAHFSVVLRLYTKTDWDDWAAFRRLIDRVPLGRRQKPLDITHPLTVAAGIKSVVVEDVVQPVQTDDGVWEIEIKLIEYRKPFVAMAKAEGAKATPADPEDAELEANRQQIAALSSEPIP